MEITPVTYRDKVIVNEWLTKRGDKTWDEKSFPSVGTMIMHEGAPIAIGYLRLCEGKVGMLDGYVTDPEIAPDLRDKALDLLTQDLIREAKYMKLHSLVSYSNHKNTIVRALKHGFNIQSSVVLTMRLT